MSTILSLPELDGVRVPGIRLSDRLLGRLRRLVATRPYFTASIAFHAALALLLLDVAAFDASKSAQAAAAGAAKTAQRIAREPVAEVILATSFTAEGEATSHVIGEALKARGITVSRLARGVPAGSELEYVDLSTIAHALADRR